MKKVTIYSTPTCHFCHLAKDFFKEHNIPYTDYDVLANVEKRQEMVNLSGQLGVPVIVIDNEVITGFDQSQISKLLELDK